MFKWQCHGKDNDMNKARRSALRGISSRLNGVRSKLSGNHEDVIELLLSIQSDIDNCRDEEESYADNMPENLQSSQRYDDAMDAVSEMEDAIDYINDVVESLNNGNLEEAEENLDYAVEAIDNASF